MATTTRFRFPQSGSLLLGVLALTMGGCGSSDRTAELAPSEEQVMPSPAVSQEPAAEPALVPEEVETSLTPPSAEVGRAETEMKSESEQAVAQTDSQQPVGPAQPEKTAAAPQPAPANAAAATESQGTERQPITRTSLPKAKVMEGPRLGMNPLRNGSDRSPGHRLRSTPSTSVEKAGSGKGKHGHVPFDPVKENGPIFVGWPRPKAAVVITGRQEGYLEPCGCAGLDRMKGGLSRRLSMFDELRNRRGWAVAAVDVGGLVKGFGPQADLKFQTTINAMQAMQYDAIALGKSDLQFGVHPVDSLLSVGDRENTPFLSANVALLGFEEKYTPQRRIVEAGGIKLGITSVLGKKWQREISDPLVELADPLAKLVEPVSALEQQCDYLILLAHATREESIELARQFPQIDIVVTAGGQPEPPREPQFVDGSKTMLIEVGEKGMNAVVLGFYEAGQPIRYQRVPLDSRFPQSGYAKKLMTEYQEMLKEAGLEGLGVTEVPYPGKELMGKFVGSEECKSCHEESYRVWKKSGHAKAWKTLVELDPPRIHDPECIACHVVGWTPQNYRPFQSGFLSEHQTPQLINVGCETCHGPGQKHVEAEMGSDFDLQEKLRKATVITLEQSQEAVSTAVTNQQPCMNCHDLDNSPDFDFPTYWPKIEHHEE